LAEDESRRVVFWCLLTRNSHATIPPKAELETKAVLRNAIAGNKTLAELKGADDRAFLNPKLLDLLRGQEK